MTRSDGTKVKCPCCGWFVVRIVSAEAFVEVNCANGRCGETLVIKCRNTEVTVNVTSKVKQA